jgi:hypothetical protein
LQAKQAFEAYAKTQEGVVVKHYHADNGCFIEKAFRDHFKNSNKPCLSPDPKPTFRTQRLLSSCSQARHPTLRRKPFFHLVVLFLFF